MLTENVIEVEKHVQAACDRAGRSRDEVTLIAVSKITSNIVHSSHSRCIKRKTRLKITERELFPRQIDGLFLR